MNAKIFVEGGSKGPHSKALNSECREGFRKLLEKCGYKGRVPALVACGSRADAYRDFGNELRRSTRGGFVGLWVDSEDPVENIEKAWEHLKNRPGDKWDKPGGAVDEHVLFMTTCMETMFVADREALKAHFGKRLRESALPPLVELEARKRHDVQDCLAAATKDCPNQYAKGRHSYEVLGMLAPEALERHLPSFRRIRRILDARL